MLFSLGPSALITYVLISVALFTQGWITAANNKQSEGIFPWRCVSEKTCDDLFWKHADGWTITAFLAMLFDWIVQFFVLLSVAITLVSPAWHYHLSRGFTGQQLIVTVLLLYVLIVYGATYNRSTQVLNTLSGDVYLDYSYLLCVVATLFSLTTLILGGAAVRNDGSYHQSSSRVAYWSSWMSFRG